MSMPSNDGQNSEDAFCSSSELPHFLAQQQGGAVRGVSLPPHMLWPGTQFVQATHPHHQQQNQQYNEFMYNVHPQAFAQTAGQPETYSVLPVGHGNFLKVYHCPENAAGGLPNDGSYHHQSQPPMPQFQQQHQLPYHLLQSQQSPPPPPAPPQMFNSYELFSSNNLMPMAESQANINHEIPAQSSPVLLLNNSNNHDESTVHSGANTSTTNMIINKLVNNWSPNLTSGTYTQFGAPVLQNSHQACVNENLNREPAQIHSVIEETNNLDDLIQVAQPQQPQVMNHLDVPPPLNGPPKVSQQQQQHQQQLHQHQPVSPVVPVNHSKVDKPTPATIPHQPVPTPTYQAVATAAPEVKKRIVAEVKPMRMTYSDVLSKFNNQQSLPSQTINTKHNSSRSGKHGAPVTSLLIDRKTDNKYCAETTNTTVNGRRQMNGEDGINQQRSVKKGTIYDNKENVQLLSTNGRSNKRAKNNNSNNNNSSSSSTQSGSTINVQQKTINKPSQKQNVAESSSKKRNNKDDADLSEENKKSVKSATVNVGGNGNGNGNGNGEKDFNSFYVAAKKSETNERTSKPAPPAPASNASNLSARKPNKFSTNSQATNSANQANNSNANRGRYSNAATNSGTSSYSYSSKRNRNANFSTYSSSGSATVRNPNYELAQKLLRTWYEYTFKVLNWLFYLIYDIVVLGCTMFYERLIHTYENALTYGQQLRKDLRENSNKPTLWLKNYWRRFDARFKKNSIWAFWRRFYKKKPPETTGEPFKNGRLPHTGEEAMYSLLNCKGKDAYSILGVPPDSSQEQIRKHYKKIAVLVHPDKNKQAGAEEAFKVLQRAFELIGEPEKRLAYDQSLAEALHAEKAWTELHDLLSQLQTKITEAANTIRCSTCGLRHPRKVTDRPHYAARECTSCKIRHSAREGDIWAETAFMGFRWKYLALMEGKVYDITEWANCQKGALAHLEPNSHMVQYRIVRGAQHQQQQQQYQQQQQQQQSHAHQHHSPHHGPQYQNQHGAGVHHDRNGPNKFKRDIPPSEASLHEFLDNLYSGQHPNQPNSTAFANSTRRRTRRN